VNEGQLDLDTLVDRGSSQALSDPLTLGFGGDVLADLRKVLWASGIVDMGKGFARFRLRCMRRRTRARVARMAAGETYA
jgi:hypothetical protein